MTTSSPRPPRACDIARRFIGLAVGLFGHTCLLGAQLQSLSRSLAHGGRAHYAPAAVRRLERPLHSRRPAGARSACREGDPMKRREFIMLVGGCGARVTACGARSRASACDAIGVLMPHARYNPVGPPGIAALLQELELLGWTACRSVEIDVRLGPARRSPTRITPSAQSSRTRSSSARSVA